MANLAEQLEEIKTLLPSPSTSQKPYAYSTLLNLQEQATSDPALIHSLADSSRSLISLILIDISSEDEEIAAQALKCLGFMIYHPSLASVISASDACMVVELLEKVITTTRIKSVCNLGVWCISIQQLDASFLAEKFHSLLRAIIHALDNPVGSLSITFEAMQAVIKLTSQLSDMMKETSNIWVPPIYRRLLSRDKREKDMAQRYLLKIRSTIYPPSSALSKVVFIDMKSKLLATMKELLYQGLKIQSLQAWGWYIRLIGPYALKNKNLINEMLKIPEQTFTDLDPQIQIASQVAWEGLIDALIQPSKQAPETNRGYHIQQVETSVENKGDTEGDRLLKRIKLIMTPLTGIISSKCDISVHLSCLKTWYYLLHKLDTSVNFPSVIKCVWEPILEVVFHMRPDNKNTLLLNICLDLLDEFALARSKDVRYDLNDQESPPISDGTPIAGPCLPGELSWKHYPVKWLPWDLNQLDFQLNMVHILISHCSLFSVAPEIKSSLCTACLQIFRTVLRGVKNILRNSSTTYKEVMLCVSNILMFVKKICEGAIEDGSNNYLLQVSLQFVKAVTEELDTSTLGSPLYKVALDFKYIDNMRTVSELREGNMLLGTLLADNMNMVTPIVCLTVLYISVLIKLTSDVSEAGSILPGTSGYLFSVLSSYGPLDILHAINGLLYKHFPFECLDAWLVIAKCLKDYIGSVKNLSALDSETDAHGYIVLSHFLCHPFAVLSCRQRLLSSVKTNGSVANSVSLNSQREPKLEKVAEMWRLLYISINSATEPECSSSKSFSEDLCSMLKGLHMLEFDSQLNQAEKNQDHEIFCLCGEAVVCVLEQTVTYVKAGGNASEGSGGCRASISVNNILEFASRFLNLPWTKVSTSSIDLGVVSRVFSTLVRFVGCLYFKEHIILFMEVMGGPLCEWISHVGIHNESSKHQLQLLWVKFLNSLRMSWPPINFDSSFLKLQAPLLESTLDHPNIDVSEPTIKFWNSTYGEQIKLSYPESLVPILDKLSRNGTIKLCRGSHSKLNDGISVPRVTTTLNLGSKRVELVEGTKKDRQHDGLNTKRKRVELTEHQKEVRRAQQGRVRDCDGRGPGIRTYTSVDFSQGNEESQESQEIRNADAILEMLRKDGKLS